jgi:zinc transporter ZupT
MTNLIVIPIAVATGLATLVGGLFAIALRERLHLVLGFSAGAVIGVAFFDLLPEALETARFNYSAVLAITALGFFVYVLLDRVMMHHSHAEAPDHVHYARDRERRGWLGAGSFLFHSFLDGFAIGVAFHADRSVGIVVAAAVLVHDFSDGLNTVNVVTRNGGDRASAFRWLLADSAAPLLGVAASLIINLPQDGIGIVLALFAGFFLYIGASDLLPESHRGHPRFVTTVATFMGAATLYIVTLIAR